MRKKIAIFIISLLYSFSPHAVRASAAASYNYLEALIEEALQNNPELKAYGERIHAYEQRPSQARSLDDPMIGFAFLNLPVDTFAFDQEAMTQKQISVKQKFPFPGKLEIKSEIAESDLDIVKEEYAGKRNAVVMMVKSEYSDLLFIKKAISITNSSRDLLTDFIRTAETDYAVGRGAQGDVLKIQLELSNILKQIVMLDQQKATVEARLNSLLNRSGGEIITGEITQTVFNMSAEELGRTAESSNPVLKALDHQIKKAERSAALAKKEFYPDFELGLSYGQREDSEMAERPDFFSASVMVNIPLWYKSKESSRVAEENANTRMAGHRYNAMKNDIYFQIVRIIAEIKRHDQDIDLFRTGIIPQSTLAHESAMAAYKVNRAGLMTVIKSRVELNNYEIEYSRSITSRERRLAELEATVGKRLF